MNSPPMMPSIDRPIADDNSGSGSASVTGCENPVRPTRLHAASRT
jgi:hypothetical protein